MGQSIVLSEIQAEILLQSEIPSHQNVPLQQDEERIKMLSQESKVSRFCMEAGYMRIVEVGQYFMTKDTGDFRQFRSVSGLSRIHSSSRRSIFTTKRMDSRKPENWTCVGSHDQLVIRTVNMELKLESGL